MPAAIHSSPGLDFGLDSDFAGACRHRRGFSVFDRNGGSDEAGVFSRFIRLGPRNFFFAAADFVVDDGGFRRDCRGGNVLVRVGRVQVGQGEGSGSFPVAPAVSSSSVINCVNGVDRRINGVDRVNRVEFGVFPVLLFNMNGGRRSGGENGLGALRFTGFVLMMILVSLVNPADFVNFGFFCILVVLVGRHQDGHLGPQGSGLSKAVGEVAELFLLVAHALRGFLDDLRGHAVRRLPCRGSAGRRHGKVRSRLC